MKYVKSVDKNKLHCTHCYSTRTSVHSTLDAARTDTEVARSMRKGQSLIFP